MEKITGESPDSKSADLVTENVEQLRRLFPEAFSEEGLNFETLRELLGSTATSGDERYGLNWSGKKLARKLALTPSSATLRPTSTQSLNWDETRNIHIEGENLEVIKLLQRSYSSKVKLIYIDPPYNTGKDFVYKDKFDDSLRNYLAATGQIDDDGSLKSSATDAVGRRHTNWLNMIYPRIKVAKSLLARDGILLVSISDVEVASLKFVLDDIFGEENFVCQFIWNNEGNVDQQSKIKGVHEYILCYANDLDTLAAPAVIDPNIDENSKLFNETIENSITKNGPANPPSEIVLPVGFPATFTDGEVNPRSDKWPHIKDRVVVKEGKLIQPAAVYSGWSSRNLLELFIRNGCEPIKDGTGKETWFSLTETGAIYGYKRRSEDQGHVLSVIRNVGTTKQNSGMLSGWGINFSYPKPVLLIQYLVEIFTSRTGGQIVLDFFAGSGTTGHAVMAQNHRDGGDRRFVLVQMPEPLADGSHGDIEDISGLSRKRLVAAAKSLGSKPGDRGFRSFRLDSSNVRSWAPDNDDVAASLEASVEHLRQDRTNEDLLFELLLKLGFDLSSGIEKRGDDNRGLYSIGAGTLIACLDRTISQPDVEAIASSISQWRDELGTVGDTQVIFRDSAFSDDGAKTNMSAILQQNGISNVRSI